MKYSMRYGSQSLEFDIPKKNVKQYITVKEMTAERKNADLLSHALANPLNAPSLKDAVAGKHVVLLLEDATRDVAIEDVFPFVARELTGAKFVDALIATGTHNPELAGNKAIIDTLTGCFNEHAFANFKITAHDSRRGPFLDCGTTSFGNKILCNPLVEKGDVYLALSDMKNHYFAGYSNGVKDFLPGVCAFETVERNHALALEDNATYGFHPWHADPARHDNPLARDMAEGFELMTAGKPVFVLATIEKAHKILWAEFGEIKSVSANGMKTVDQLMSQKVEPADLLIVSPGGFPNDETIYTAQRALELSKNAVKPGGKILFLAECRNGIGPASAKENFFDLLAKPLPEVFKLLEEKYVLYSHKAYKFARLIENVAQIVVHSELSDAQIEQIHLHPVDDPLKWLAEELKKNPEISINLVTDGNKIALHN